MENKVEAYTFEQMEQIQEFIERNFGDKGDCIIHERKSKYVHTDIMMANNEEGNSYVTFGMGAGETDAPLEDFSRVELVASTSCDFDVQGERGLLLAAEIMALTKFPFRNATWFGPGHTVGVSEKFKNAFGFGSVLFAPTELCAEIDGIGKVSFLKLIPIYDDEREWIMEHDSFVYMDMLYEKFGDRTCFMDLEREHYIPDEDEAAEVSVMNALGIDRETLDMLNEYLAEMEEKGEKITYDTITDWIKENV